MPHQRPENDDPRQRLVAVVIDQIEQHGLAHVTVRGIAAAAGMNIAAVNYYFHSKAALLDAAREGSVRHMVEDSEAYLARMPEDPLGVLTELLAYYFEGSLRYPRMTRAHLHDAFIADDYTGVFPTLFAPVVERLRGAVQAAVPNLGAPEAARRSIAALSAVFLPAFFAKLYIPLGALETLEDRSVYVNEVARRTLAPVTDAHDADKRSRRRGAKTS